MLTPTATLNRLLETTASVQVTDLYGLGRDAVDKADMAEFPNAQCLETLDGKTCPLCRRVHGMIVARTDPRYRQYIHPSHIHCRRIWVFIGAQEKGDDGKPLKPNWVDPDPELVKKHGHFHVDPNKYAPLRIPSRPEGRDFIFTVGKDGQRKLIWRPGLSAAARRATINDMMSLMLTDPKALSLSGPLLQLLMQWSAEEVDFKDLAGALAFRGDWPELQTDFDFVALAYRLSVSEGCEVAAFELPSGAVRIALYNAGVLISERTVARDVAMIYDPVAAQIETLQKHTRATLMSQPAFVAITGFGGSK